MTGFYMKCNTGLKWVDSCCQSNSCQSIAVNQIVTQIAMIRVTD